MQAEDLDYQNIMLESENRIYKPSSKQGNPCPGERRCSCWTREFLSKLQTIVLCNKRNLNEVPTKLPNTTVWLDLSSNYIRTLGNSSFKGYPDLIVLTLAHNQLTQIKPGNFDGLQKLQNLSFRNNAIRYNASGFQPGSFKPLVSLKTLNIQQNFTRNDFREESYDLEALSDLVKLKTLHLDGMPFKNLGEVFENLDSLTEIIFNGKWGRCLIWKMTPDFFPSNTFLKKITIQNCEMKQIQAESFAHLSHLVYLDLSYNEELTFRCMKNLTDGLNTQIEVIKLNKLHSTLGPCVILTEENLRGFDNLALKEIHLESNRIATLEKTAAKYIPNTLETISVRDNSFRMDTYVFYFLARHTFSNLRNFIFSDQYTNHVFPAFQTPNQSQIDRQIQSRTKRDKKAILHSLPLDMQKQNKSYNKMELTATLHNETPMIVEKDKEFDMKTDMKMTNEVHITKRHSEVYDDVKKKSALDESFTIEGMTDSKKEQATILRGKIAKLMQGFPITLPENFTKLDASNNKISLALYKVRMTEPNNLREINMRKNLYSAWIGPFEGFKNLTKLDLSWNFCFHMTLNVFRDMPNLEMLNIGRNYLATSLNYDKNGAIFQNQGRLTTLIMSDNKLQTLPKNIFMGLKNLKELNLAKNLLKTFEVDLSHMNQLHALNLQNNQLETISQSARKVFDKQARALNFTLNLRKNNFKCDCENLDFIKWISESPVKFQSFRNYVCYFKDRTKGNLTNAASIYQTLAEECTNYTPVIVSSTAALVLILSLTAAAVVYRYRWNLRYLYYMTKYKAKTAMPKVPGYEPIEAEDDLLETVNVSYADEDCGFVRQKIYTELEVNRGLKLHIRDRDNPVDERFVSDNIMDAIESTKKTLIIMSRAYLKHRWCIFEMNMAGIKALKTDKDMLCVLLLEEVPHKDLPLKIMKIIKDQEHIEYPGNENLQDCYWDRLKDALTRF